MHRISKVTEKTGFSHHMLNTGHLSSKTEDVITVLKTAKKDSYTNSIENYYIQINNKGPPA
jgi:hypothetical protein